MLKHFALRPNEIWSTITSQRVYVRSDQGSLWLTQEGDKVDFVIEEGNAFLSARPGKIVVQALTEAKVTIGEGKPPRESQDAKVSGKRLALRRVVR